MIQLTYQELYRLNRLEAKKILLQNFRKTGGNFLRTAKELGCSRNTVKKFVRRQETGLPLEVLSRRPVGFRTVSHPSLDTSNDSAHDQTVYHPF